MKCFVILAFLLAVAYAHVAKYGAVSSRRYGAEASAAAVAEESETAESSSSKSEYASSSRYAAGARSASYAAQSASAAVENEEEEQEYSASKQKKAAVVSQESRRAANYRQASAEAQEESYEAAAESQQENYRASSYKAAAASKQEAYSASSYRQASAEEKSASRYRSSVKTRSAAARVSESSASSTCVQEWPALSDVPLFQRIANLASNVKSQQISQTVLQKQQIDIPEVFSELSKRNSLFVKYIKAATGVQYKTQEDREVLVKVIRQEPTSFLRMIHLFAKNPLIFKSDVGQYLISTTSSELLDKFDNKVELYNHESSYQTNFIGSVVKSGYYRKCLGKFFGLRATDETTVRTSYTRFVQQYPVGAALLARKILLRQELGDIVRYRISAKNRQVHVREQSKKVRTTRIYRHNPYYRKYISIRKSSTVTRQSSTRVQQSVDELA